MTDLISGVRDSAGMAVDVARMPTFLGGIGGIVVGGIVGGLIATSISFNGTAMNALAAAGEFLVGAGLYGLGLSGRVAEPALRSATQVSGVVVAGMGLGKLLSLFGAPTFGLGLEDAIGDPATLGDDYGRMVGQDFHGRAVGQWSLASEDEDLTNTDYQWDWRNAEDQSYDYNPESFNPNADPSVTETPSWTPEVGGIQDVWGSYVAQGFMMPSSPMGGVDQWYGSAEGDVAYSPAHATLGNMVKGAEGMGSVVGQ